MADRNDRKNIVENNDEFYKDKVKARGLSKISHFTVSSSRLRPVTTEVVASLTVSQEIWKRGDRMYKYAHKYYGDATYWWVIAWFNTRPTDAHYRIGEIFMIPTPLEDALQRFND